MTRTSDLRFRKPPLYPTELLGQAVPGTTAPGAATPEGAAPRKPQWDENVKFVTVHGRKPGVLDQISGNTLHPGVSPERSTAEGTDVFSSALWGDVFLRHHTVDVIDGRFVGISRIGEVSLLVVDSGIDIRMPSHRSGS